MMTTNWIRKFAQARCGTKQAFRKPDKADAAAMEASLKTGELIISYQCYDMDAGISNMLMKPSFLRIARR